MWVAKAQLRWLVLVPAELSGVVGAGDEDTTRLAMAHFIIFIIFILFIIIHLQL